MRHLNEEYIPRQKRSSISKIDLYSCHPKTKEELQLIIIDRILNEGNTCNLNDIDVSSITDMSHLFDAYPDDDGNRNRIFKDFNGDISLWDVSNVTNMSHMFYMCYINFNVDISLWNVSNVRDMNHMFSWCEKFDQNLSNWDVSSVTDMNHMFYGCKDFKSDLSRWDVSNVTNMMYMFDGCKSFNSDLSKWNVSKVANIRGMFLRCESFKYDLSSWNISKEKLDGMKYLNEEYIPRKRTNSISRINTEIPYIHFFSESKETPLELPNLIMYGAAFTDGFEYSLDKENWEKVTKEKLFKGIEFDNDIWLRGVSEIGTGEMSIKCINCFPLSIEGDIRTLVDWKHYTTCDTSKAMFKTLFFSFDMLEDASLLKLNIMSLCDFCYEGMFMNCVKLKYAPDLPATEIGLGCYLGIFAECKSLINKAKMPEKINGKDLSYHQFLLGNMYDGCPLFNNINEEYVPRQRRASISKLEQYTCHPETKEELQEIIIKRIENEGDKCNLNDIDVSLITDMSDLFNANKNLKDGNEIFLNFNGDLSRWDVSNVTNMSYMFNRCKNFDLDLSNWDVSNVTNMKFMFFWCKSFNSDLSRWDVSRVKDMEFMFDGCESFNSNISSWNVSNVTDMSYMFRGCDRFNQDLSNWDISKAKYTLSVRDHIKKHINEEYIPKLSRASISRIEIDDTPYIHLYSNGKQTLTLNHDYKDCGIDQKVKLEYSTDKIIWNVLTDKIIDKGIQFVNGNLWLRGKSNVGTCVFDYGKCMNCKFTTSNKVSISGDIRTLIDWEDYERCSTYNACFAFLFNNCEQVTDISLLKLNSMELSYSCYKAMFSHTNIDKAPDLPAEEFSAGEHSYDYMFYNCKKLTAKARIPKTLLEYPNGYLAEYYMYRMYEDCPCENDEDLFIEDEDTLNEEYIPRLSRTSISKLDPYSCHPETKEELREIIIEHINEEGNECNLNDIDVSGITDMSYLFNANKNFHDGNKIFLNFNGNISRWDVSNVTNMEGMFNWCGIFNGDISLWIVSRVTNMSMMFYSCNKFNQDLSLWDVSRVTKMNCMFYYCEKFNQDLSRWNVSNVEDMSDMFWGCDSFKYDLSNWNISKAEYTKTVRQHMKYINEEYVPRLSKTSITRIEKDIPYIHFLSDGLQELSVSRYSPYMLYSSSSVLYKNINLQYSYDCIEWFDWTFKDMKHNSLKFKDGNLWLRGKCHYGTASKKYPRSLTIEFCYNNDTDISGDIRTLIDREHYLTCDTSKACFAYLFSRCFCLRDVSNLFLSIKDVTSKTYYGMFENCTRLTKKATVTKIAMKRHYDKDNDMYYGCPCCHDVDVCIEDNGTLNEEYIPHKRKSSISVINKKDPLIHLRSNGHLIMSTGFRSKVLPGLEYSLDRINWFDLDKNTLYQGIEFKDGNLWLRGSNPKGTADYHDYNTYSLTLSFETEAEITVSGDIRTLIDWEDYLNCDTREACFESLFSYCSLIVDVSELELNILDLAPRCYTFLFMNTSITQPPKLPATTLSEKCYCSMFSGCNNLSYAPELPADILAKECYSCMFCNCVKLITPPKLDAKTLAEECYNCMFYNCTSLIEAPDLPAIELVKGCYSYMFVGCVSLNDKAKIPEGVEIKYDFGKCMYLNCPLLRRKEQKTIDFDNTLLNINPDNSNIPVLNEGGNMIKSSEKVRQDIGVKIAEKIISDLKEGMNIEACMLGSLGKKQPELLSGDIDIAVLISRNDEEMIGKFKQFILEKWNKNIEIEDIKGFSIISIGFPYKIEGIEHIVLIDFVLSDDLEYTKFMYHSPNFLKGESQYKGLYRTNLLCIVAKMTPIDIDRYPTQYFTNEFNGMYSGEVKSYYKYVLSYKDGLKIIQKSYEGIKKRLKNPKTTDFLEIITKNIDEILHIIMGPTATKNDCNSFESIVNFLVSDKYIYNNQEQINKIFDAFFEDKRHQDPEVRPLLEKYVALKIHS